MLRIIVDSGSSIKEAEKKKYGVDILPLGVQIGEDSYQDGQTLTVDNFYDRLRASKSFPKTSCIGFLTFGFKCIGYRKSTSGYFSANSLIP